MRICNSARRSLVLALGPLLLPVPIVHALNPSHDVATFGFGDRLVTRNDDGLRSFLDANSRLSSGGSELCPSRCNHTTASENWFLLADLTRLARCNETMMLGVAVESRDMTGLKACTADFDHGLNEVSVPASNVAALCPTANFELVEAAVSISTVASAVGNVGLFSSQHALSAVRQVRQFLSVQSISCSDNAIAFGYSQSAIVGVFAGVELHQHGLTLAVLDKVHRHLEQHSPSVTTIWQLCLQDSVLGADYSLGIVISPASDIKGALGAVASWARGSCASTKADPGLQDWMRVEIRVPYASSIGRNMDSQMTGSTNAKTALEGNTAGLERAASLMVPRGNCKVITVNKGDGCYAVAQRCGISQAQLTKYNTRKNFCSTLVIGEKVCCTSGTLPSSIPPARGDGTCTTKVVQSGDSCGSMASKCGLSANDFTKVNTKKNLCSTLQVGQQVCCSNGKLPNRRPKPQSDGTCATYAVKKGDSCGVIAAWRDLTVADLESFNKKTWGWNGCSVIFPDFRMCVSTGNAPMPAPVSNAVCGPTVPGSASHPPKGVTLADMNPCPLKACCNVWGQCGLSDDFCLTKPSKTGAPGTSGLHNGCVSSCGMDIIKGSPPSSKINVAYFEAWNSKRPCLTMDADMIDTSKYTHVHFAFAELTPTFQVNISSVQDQFDRFKGLSGVKKIISFGGWDFSASPGTYNVLREAVKPANRDIFKNNVVNFVTKNALDGIDLDWEYPGAPDIPGIPADDPKNGINYYQFLTSVKSALGKSKSVSFAAPASYWYLRAYPVDMMAKDLDYLIFMTYDLHGQWDYGNKWTSPGCPTGNCLRSHVNDTETMTALAMITKAGVPSNKVVVGVASYGRSFKMEKAGCDGPLCKFTGSPRISNAAKGRCTQTGGYISNAEIRQIISNGKATKQYKAAGSNILVYNSTEWVAYMDDATKAARANTYASYNFAGITDWAVDLQSFDSDDDSADDDYEQVIDGEFWPDCGGSYSSLDSLKNSKASMDPYCVEKYVNEVEVVITKDSMRKYNDLINGGYDDKFNIYQEYVKELVPLQVNAFMASDEAQKYFKCTQSGTFQCCNSCRYHCQNQGDCQTFAGCKDGEGTVDIKCPQMEYELDMLDNTSIPNATFILADKEGFWKAIGDQYGIEESFISWGRRHMRTNNGCQFAGKDIRDCQDQQDNWFYNYPNGDSDKVTVYNPKDIVSDSYKKTSDMLSQFTLIKDYTDWDDVMPWSDAVDAMSLPSLSLQTAVNNMQEIVKQANEIKKREREEFILDMLMGILFFIPFAGDAVGAAGLTATRSLIRLIGDVGDAGLTAYGAVKDPKNAFNTVFEYLLGRAISDVDLGKASKARRAMEPSELGSLGKIKDDLSLMDDVRERVCAL